MILESNLEPCQRATKMCIAFDRAISLLGLYPQEIIKMGKGPACTKIFIAALFVVAKNWKSREMIEQVVIHECNGILLCYKK